MVVSLFWWWLMLSLWIRLVTVTGGILFFVITCEYFKFSWHLDGIDVWDKIRQEKTWKNKSFGQSVKYPHRKMSVLLVFGYS